MTASSDTSTLASSQVATYQDVLDAPPNMVAEIISGRLYTTPPLAPPQCVAMSNLLTWTNWTFGIGAGDSRAWRVVGKPEIHLGEDVLVPDIAAWRFDRMPKQLDAAYYSLSPDWACEVLSDLTEEVDWGAKRDLYAAYEVAYLWMIDPIARTLDAFSLEEGNWAGIGAVEGGAEVRLQPFDAASFRLCYIWGNDFDV